jgi:hypothetical protein
MYLCAHLHARTAVCQEDCIKLCVMLQACQRAPSSPGRPEFRAGHQGSQAYNARHECQPHDADESFDDLQLPEKGQPHPI